MEEMYSYEIWDKESTIVGTKALIWLDENPRFRESDVIIVKNSGVVVEVSSIDMCRVSLGMDAKTSTTEQVAEKYIYNYNNNLGQEPEQIQRWKEKEIELAQAKLLLLREGLI